MRQMMTGLRMRRSLSMRRNENCLTASRWRISANAQSELLIYDHYYKIDRRLYE
jgi:hypothetical protein